MMTPDSTLNAVMSTGARYSGGKEWDKVVVRVGSTSSVSMTPQLAVRLMTGYI